MITLEDFINIFMLIIAITLDVLGLIAGLLTVIGAGISFSFIPDILGLLTIGAWSFLKSGKIKLTKNLVRLLVKLGVTEVIEIIPLVGDISPSWTLFVISEIISDLREKSGSVQSSQLS
jgi:hypothetical protein